jgi:hypothetical protein
MLCPPLSEALETSGKRGYSICFLTARLSMNKVNESEALDKPPRYFDLPRMMELWVRDSLTKL